MGTLLEAIGIAMETHFRFGFPNGLTLETASHDMALCTRLGACSLFLCPVLLNVCMLVYDAEAFFSFQKFLG